MSLNKHKCSIWVMLWMVKGLGTAQKKLSAIKDAPEPTNTTELKAFLGILNYFGRFYQTCFLFYSPCMLCCRRTRHGDGRSKGGRNFKRLNKSC